MSYEEALATTQALFEKVGLDQSTFNEKSVKTFHDLVMEVMRGEALLVELDEEELRNKTIPEELGMTASGNAGWIKRIAWSTKLIIRTETEYLAEMYRKYPGKDASVIKRSNFSGIMLDRPNWTLSETGKGEDPLLVTLRALDEELGVVLSSKELLKPINPGWFYSDAHISSVYHQVMTENYTSWYEWVLESRSGEDKVIRRDDKVELHLEWQPLNSMIPKQT